MTIQGKIRKEQIQFLDKLNHFIMGSPEDIHSSILRGLTEVISELLVIFFSEKLWKTEEIPETGSPGNCRAVILTSVPGKSQELFIREKKKVTKRPQGGEWHPGWSCQKHIMSEQADLLL